MKFSAGHLTFANYTGFLWDGEHITERYSFKLLSVFKERFF